MFQRISTENTVSVEVSQICIQYISPTLYFMARAQKFYPVHIFHTILPNLYEQVQFPQFISDYIVIPCLSLIYINVEETQQLSSTVHVHNLTNYSQMKNIQFILIDRSCHCQEYEHGSIIFYGPGLENKHRLHIAYCRFSYQCSQWNYNNPLLCV